MATTSSVLAVVAHPDDEIFLAGMLAHLADTGTQVTLLCATRGEMGKVHPSLGHVADVAGLRSEELRLSCARLGIGEPRFLGFHDSGRGDRLQRDNPRALAVADMLEVEAAIRNVIRDLQPRVIITHDPHGTYYHPDHLALQRATTAAFFSSGVLGRAAPARLFYAAMEHASFRRFVDASGGRSLATGLDPDVYAPTTEMIALTFDARPYVARKFSAMAAHRSAFGLTEETLRVPTPEIAPMLRAFAPVFEREDYLLGGTRGPIPRWPLPDVFEGT
jgi:N-acetyl-1-D-myo-inositol-2-amino-2-deoxy-alpha-D-glucopyranoside deacetylase